MSTNDQRAVHPGRTWTRSQVVARLRLVREYLRAHDRLAEPASAAADHHRPDLSVDYGVRS